MEKNIYIPKIRSRHPSHAILRNTLHPMPIPSAVFLGSTTKLNDPLTLSGKRFIINHKDAVQRSSDKLLMKKSFSSHRVKTAPWIELTNNNVELVPEGVFFNTDVGRDIYMEYPFIAKHRMGSRNTGNTLIKSEEDFEKWCKNKCFSNYIIERYNPLKKEYRVHVTKDGCFYACRKMLKKDTPNDQKWHRHNDNCIWVTRYKKNVNPSGEFVSFSTELNPEFEQPSNWDDVILHAVRSLQSVGLNIGAIDLRVGAEKNKEGQKVTPDFFIIETNSAPAFGTITAVMYQKEIERLILDESKRREDSPAFKEGNVLDSYYRGTDPIPPYIADEVGVGGFVALDANIIRNIWTTSNVPTPPDTGNAPIINQQHLKEQKFEQKDAYIPRPTDSRYIPTYLRNSSNGDIPIPLPRRSVRRTVQPVDILDAQREIIRDEIKKNLIPYAKKTKQF
jgi:D-alanine-D-alanine ligase-like ATP-grasp enzyme